MKILKFSFLFYSIWMIIGILCEPLFSIYKSLAGLLVAILCVLILSINPINAKLANSRSFFYLNVVFLMVSCFFLGSVVAALNKEHQVIASSTNIAEIQKKLNKSSSYSKYISKVYPKDNSGLNSLVLLYIKSDTLKVGDIIAFEGNVSTFESVKNIGQFDYKQYNENQGVYQQAFVQHYQSLGRYVSAFTEINEWRGNLIMHIDRSEYLSSTTQSLLKALLLGDKTTLDSDIQDSFKELGIMHILAISGLHIGILFLLLDFIFKPLPRRLRLFCLLLCLWIFVFLSGFSPSVFRAVMMFSAISVSRVLKRETSTLHIVSLCLFFSLLYKPSWLTDVGFQLSYLAVIGIVVLMPLFDAYYSKYKTIKYFQSLIYVSLVAQLSVLPLQFYYFGKFPIFFLPANMFIIPTFTLVLILGVIWMVTSYINVFIASFIGKVINTICLKIVDVIYYLSTIEWFKSITINLTLLEVGLFSTAILFFLLLIRKRSYVNYMLFFSSCLLFQGLLLYSCYQYEEADGVIIPYSYKEDFSLLVRHGQTISCYSNMNDNKVSFTLINYQKQENVSNIAYFKEQFIHFLGDSRFMVLSPENDFYDKTFEQRISHLVIKGKLKVNYDRVLSTLVPKEVIIHNSVPFSIKKMIIESCLKKNIPYYDISSKGYYKQILKL